MVLLVIIAIFAFISCLIAIAAIRVGAVSDSHTEKAHDNRGS